MLTKVKFRESLKTYVQDELGSDWEKLDNVARSKAMTRFYVQQILSKIAPGRVPEDQDDFESCLVDGANDCGVDFIFCTEGRVLIIQSKFHGEHRHQDIGEFTDFCDVLRKLHPKYKLQKNQKLQEAIPDIDWSSDAFELQFLTLGKVGENLRTRAEQGDATPIPEIRDFEDRVELTLCDEHFLNEALREALTAGETLATEVEIKFIPDDYEKPWLRIKGPHDRMTYIGHVTGSQLAELNRPIQHRFRLFSLNIRDYVGDTSTNKGIKKTAVEAPTDFQFFNNGIAAIATSVAEEEERGILRCRNFSIINGAQTVRSLEKAHRTKPSALKDVTVMMRIFKVSLKKEPELTQDITRYNNTQNKITLADFRSNDPVQRSLANHFRSVRLGTKWFWYKHKRSGEKRGEAHPVDMEEFAKAVHSFRFGPPDMWGGVRALFDASPSGRYAHVFGDGTDVWSVVSERDFRLLAGIWFVCQVVRAHWKNKRKELQDGKDPVQQKALERRWMVYYTVGKFLQLLYEAREENLEEQLRA